MTASKDPQSSNQPISNGWRMVWSKVAAPFSAHQAGAENWKIHQAVSWSPGFLECAAPTRNGELTVPKKIFLFDISWPKCHSESRKTFQKLPSRCALCASTSCDLGRRHTLEAIFVPQFVFLSGSLNQCIEPFFPVSFPYRPTLTTSFSHMDPFGQHKKNCLHRHRTENDAESLALKRASRTT